MSYHIKHTHHVIHHHAGVPYDNHRMLGHGKYDKHGILGAGSILGPGVGPYGPSVGPYGPGVKSGAISAYERKLHKNIRLQQKQQAKLARIGYL